MTTTPPADDQQASSTPVVADPEPDSEFNATTDPQVAAENTGSPISVPSLGARIGAEFVGSFIVIVAIIGGGMYLGITSSSDLLALPATAGIALAVAVTTFGYLSGGHFNPAVTLGAAFARIFAWRLVLPYIAAQLMGGISAAALMFILLPNNLAVVTGSSLSEFYSRIANGYGEHAPIAAINTPAPLDSPAMVAFLAEALFTLMFVSVVILSLHRGMRHRGVLIGATFTIGLVVLGPLTGGSMNPARSLAAALFSGSWALGQVWLFIAAPILGGILAGVLHSIFASSPHIGADGNPVAPVDAGTLDALVASAQPVESENAASLNDVHTPEPSIRNGDEHAPSGGRESEPVRDADGFEIRDLTTPPPATGKDSDH